MITGDVKRFALLLQQIVIEAGGDSAVTVSGALEGELYVGSGWAKVSRLTLIAALELAADTGAFAVEYEAGWLFCRTPTVSAMLTGQQLCVSERSVD